MSARALLQILSLLVLSSAPSASVSLGIVADKHFPLPLPSLPSLKSVPRLAHVHAPDCPSDGDAGSWQGQASRAGDETGRAGEGKAWEAVQRRRWGKKLESLVQGGAIRSREVLGAMTGAPRFHFCCHGGWCDPALDYPQPIGAGATISEPFVHAVCLEALAGPLLLARAAGGARALDLASGSGYITAGLALLAGPRGKVEGVEHVAGLAALSEANLRAADLQGAGRVEIRVADALDAAALPRGGFDTIHV
ncbi:S-adenosyl-L-methionine-dependent methyltransferase [Baffinella frigidus]|nr:S-adenosyl-L-methionine-dependent methyltransferase [Cryptophyta sp. CCMP2293]